MGSHLLLARFLSVDAFGLMGIVNSCTTAVELFSDLGIGQKIVHSPRGEEPAFLDTAWTLKSVRGLVLWLVTLLLAWPVALFYDTEALLYLVPVVGLGALLGGLTSTRVSSLERRLELGRVVSLQLTAQVLAAAVMLLWAYLAPSVWCLVAGGLVYATILLIGSHTVLGGARNHVRWEPAAALEIYRFGKWILPATMVYFLLVLSHRLVLAKFVTTEVLGLFNIAAFLAGFVPQAMEVLAARVLLPLFAREGDAPPTADSLLRLRGARLKLLALALPALSLLVVFGPEVVGLLYDHRYAGAGWMVQVMAAGGLVACINASAGSLLLARGDSKRHFLSLAGGAVLFGAFLVVGYLLGGWRGLVVALAAAPVARYPALAWALWRQGVWQPMVDLLAILAAGGLVGLSWWVKAGFG